MDVEIDLSNTIIETQRLVLRPWLESDLDDLYEYASVEGVGEMAGWPHHKSIEESRNILHLFIADKNVLAVVFKENNKVILQHYHANEDMNTNLKIKEIGYVLSKDYWGMGLMPELSVQLLSFALTN